MAYVLGFFSADGNMIKTNRNTHFISWYSADKDILQKIKEVMNSEHKISKRLSNTGCVFRLQIGSKQMFNDLVGLGYTPLKSRRIRLPHMPKRCLGCFIRGYFDGDGNVWVGFINKNRKTPTRVLQVAFTSISKEFLIDLRKCLRDCGIRGGSFYSPKDKNVYRLSFSTLDALRLGEIMYNEDSELFLGRKKLRFKHFREMRV